jgi:hypothetical protein
LNPSDKNISTSNPIEKESQETHWE